MRFANVCRIHAVALVCLGLSAGAAHADALPRHHKLKLPQSYTALIKPQDKAGTFTISQPLAGATVRSGNDFSIAQAVGTVHQGFYPISEASSEGLNFTGMARQLPDVTRSAANDAAGVMSWTAKFN